MPAAFRDGPEHHGGAAAVVVQFPAVLLQAFARPQNQADGVVLHAPGAGSAVQPGGFGAQPVQVRDGEEAVRVRAVAFVGVVPFGPGRRGEGFSRRFQCA